MIWTLLIILTSIWLGLVLALIVVTVASNRANERQSVERRLAEYLEPRVLREAREAAGRVR